MSKLGFCGNIGVLKSYVKLQAWSIRRRVITKVRTYHDNTIYTNTSKFTRHVVDIFLTNKIGIESGEEVLNRRDGEKMTTTTIPKCYFNRTCAEKVTG